MHPTRVVSVELAGLGPAILADLRSWARDLLMAVDASEQAIEAVVHTLTELVTNALTHGAPAGQCRLHLVPGSTLRIEVDDDSSHPATAVDPNTGTPSAAGFGLVLVNHFATAWGNTPRESGKTVWAEIDLSSDRHRTAATSVPTAATAPPRGPEAAGGPVRAR